MYFFGITVVVVVEVYKLQFIDIERHYIIIELLVIKFTGSEQFYFVNQEMGIINLIQTNLVKAKFQLMMLHKP